MSVTAEISPKVDLELLLKVYRLMATARAMAFNYDDEKEIASKK